MKTRFFMAALAALAIVGCNKELGNTELPEVNSESAVLKVNVKAAGTMTKAATGTFEYGEDAENAVSTVDFYFFDAAGAAYQVATTGTNQITWTKQNPVENVAAISDVVLVIKKSQRALPTHVVAVLNSTENYQGKSLSELATEVSDVLSNDKGFGMSNSVYVDANGAKIVATEILPENIFATSDDLGAEGSVVTDANIEKYEITPVDIYVERVAAKVRVNLPEDQRIPVKDENGVQMKDANNNDVYAEVLGWNITNCTDEAYLLKNVDPTWTDKTVGGFTWNNPAFFRSYWAKTTAAPTHPYSYDDLLDHMPEAGYDYYYENTLPVGNGFNAVGSPAGSNQTPQLLVAAKLVDKDGDAISLAKWYNVLYTVADLKTAMVNKLAAKLYVQRDENTYTSVAVVHDDSDDNDDVVFEQVSAEEEEHRYEVKVLPKDGVTYYTVNGEDVTPITGADLAAVFADLDPAMMWEEGMTYYHTNINHFGDATGIVRNHVYDITVNGVMGFGTPVYNPGLVITPEDPDEQPAANLAARINILSWHVVSNEITLQ